MAPASGRPSYCTIRIKVVQHTLPLVHYKVGDKIKFIEIFKKITLKITQNVHDLILKQKLFPKLRT